jgi:uncharacterized membrane protein
MRRERTSENPASWALHARRFAGAQTSGSRSRRIDLAVVAALTGAAVIQTFVGASSVVARTTFALPLVLVLPGYAATAALFPGRALGGAQRVLMCLGLSLMLSALGGLVLNWTPWGLQARSWALLLGSVTLAACAIAWARREEPAAATGVSAGPPGIGLSVRQGAMLVLAMAVIGGSLTRATAGVAQQQTPGFTQLWILPASKGQPQNTVQLGVKNMESTTTSYQLIVTVDGRTAATWHALALTPGRTWQTTITLHGSRASSTVVAALYRMDAPQTVYRRVALRSST